jgi:hypothetical protein
MISLDDCIAMCGLDAKEIEAIAEHEHIPEISATALADHLLHQVGGGARIREIIVDGIGIAVERARRSRRGAVDSVESLSGAPSRGASQRPCGVLRNILAER